MKTLLFALVLTLMAAAVVMANPKPVDSYGEHAKHCFKKCTHFKTFQGKCVDFEWVGTRKECCAWKTIGKGKCDLYKKIGKCVKYSKKRHVCLGHAYKQFCNKVTKHKICTKWAWKEACKKKGTNKACDQYAYHFICTKYDTASRCAVKTFVPKITFFFKKRCARYAVHQYCSKYKTLKRTIQKWVPVKAKHYKGWIDKYYVQVLEKKFRKICVEFSKKKTCVKHQHVKFSKKIGYTKKCVKVVTKKFCVAKKKIRFCTRFTPSHFCAKRVKVRVCQNHAFQKFCCNYKAKPYCTQFKTLKPRCIKKKFKQICAHRSPGQKICVKFNFVGGKKICRKFAQVSKCAKWKRICNKIDFYKPSKKVLKKKKKY
nr:unnamed protein product [Naegleria fowleri]